MRIVVSDTSCIIDLHKVDLLFALLELPYSFVIPHPLFDGELHGLTTAEKAQLQRRGLDVKELDGVGVSHAVEYFNAHPALHLNDCFALRMAEELDDAILMTGDANLRAVAAERAVEVHGVLWAADELDRHRLVNRELLQAAMHLFRDDPLVFLPLDEVRLRVRRFSRPRP